MVNNNQSRTPIDRRLAAQPITRGVRTIEPVAQMSGWHWSAGAGASSPVGALVRISPLEVRVREGEQTRTIPLEDPVGKAVQGIFFSALMVSIFCWLIMVVVHWLTQRR